MSTRGEEVILVVDDDDAVRSLVRNVLERHGYTVLLARDGEQALMMCEAFGSPPDLVLTDVNMPNLHGGELLEELAKLGPMPRVLLMSADLAHQVRKSLGDTTSPFIQKPFTIEELERKVREVLDAPGSG